MLCYFNYYQYSLPTKLSNRFNTIIDVSLDATQGDRQISLSNRLKLTLKHPKILRAALYIAFVKNIFSFLAETSHLPGTL